MYIVHDIAILLSLIEDGAKLKYHNFVWTILQKSLIYGLSWCYLNTWPSSQHPKHLLVNCLDLGFIFLKHTPREGIQDCVLTLCSWLFSTKAPIPSGSSLFFTAFRCSTQLLWQGLPFMSRTYYKSSGPLWPSSPAISGPLWHDFIWFAVWLLSLMELTTKGKWSLRQKMNHPLIHNHTTSRSLSDQFPGQGERRH